MRHFLQMRPRRLIAIFGALVLLPAAWGFNHWRKSTETASITKLVDAMKPKVATIDALFTRTFPGRSESTAFADEDARVAPCRSASDTLATFDLAPPPPYESIPEREVAKVQDDLRNAAKNAKSKCADGPDFARHECVFACWMTFDATSHDLAGLHDLAAREWQVTTVPTIDLAP